MARQRIVLTGATGLIGKAVIDILRERYDLISVGRAKPPEGTQGITADLGQPLDRSCMPTTADAVIYLAQSEHFRDFPRRSQEIFRVNVANVCSVLDWARGAGVKKFVLGSSGGIYGHGEDAFREDDVIHPDNPLGFYLASKHCAELLSAKFFDLLILRFFFVYGPGQRSSMLIPRLIDSVRYGRPITLQGHDGIRINPIYVGDAADALVRLLALEGTHKINVAGLEVLALRDICDVIGEAVGRVPVYKSEPGVPRHIIGDIAKMKEFVGVPKVGFREGLRLLLDEKQ